MNQAVGFVDRSRMAFYSVAMVATAGARGGDPIAPALVALIAAGDMILPGMRLPPWVIREMRTINLTAMAALAVGPSAGLEHLVTVMGCGVVGINAVLIATLPLGAPVGEGPIEGDE